MASDVAFSFTTAAAPPPGAGNVMINEVDADTPGSDTAEFVELLRRRRRQHAARRPRRRLLRRRLTPFTGNQSYAAFDLDGYEHRRQRLLRARQSRRAECRPDVRSGPVRPAPERPGRGRALHRPRERLPQRHRRHDDEPAGRDRLRHRRSSDVGPAAAAQRRPEDRQRKCDRATARRSRASAAPTAWAASATPRRTIRARRRPAPPTTARRRGRRATS